MCICNKYLCCLLFAVVVDVVTEFARESALCVLLHADSNNNNNGYF